MSQPGQAGNSNYQRIRLVRDVPYVLTVELNRPELKNAFDPDMIREISDAFRSVAAEQFGDIRFVILRGAGASFCAGADLGWMKSMVNFNLQENQADSMRLHEMFLAVRECPVPTLAVVQGHAMGGATGLIAACDLAAAVVETQFCFSEVKLGLAPAVISPFVLEKMSRSSATRFMLTAEVFSANDARDGGLVQFCGSALEVDEQVARWTKQILSNGPEAVRVTKSLLSSVMLKSNWSERAQITTRAIAERRVSSEGQEGLKSFLEKRKPSWIQK